ncbi:MAG: Gfo/Idh/MocA family protein [Pigmentiphaga sp.]|uniref:Gfo/Idh/MocA family oxidoreductase n=1 Tax=Pigmentiphaga daeguensis TaxID=414049 RepID=A0ABN1BTI6_9BURK
MNIAIVGCGFVADFYMATLRDHPQLRVIAAHDIVAEHAERFHRHWGIPVFVDAAEMLAAHDFQMVLNLTNPDSHYAVSKRFLNAGKHVYSEKPMAMQFEQARELVELARSLNLHFTSAPCNHLGEAPQAMARALAQGCIGTPRLTYAEMDDNFIALAPYRNWRSASGAYWPYRDEFAVGCTLEHAGYNLAWLLLFFGPVRRIVAYQSLRFPGKPIDGEHEAPDFSLAALEFHSGMVARLTCSIVAPHDHGFRIIGDEGVLHAADCWFYRTSAYYRRYLRIRNRFMLSPIRHRLPLTPTGPATKRRGSAAMDFARGPREMSLAIEQGRPSRVPADFALHFNEIALAIHHADTEHPVYHATTTFVPLPPVTDPIL